MAEYTVPMLPIIAMEHDVRLIQDETIVRAVHDITGITVDRDRLVQALTNAKAFYEEGYQAGKNAPDVVHGRWEYHDCVCTGDGLAAVYACSNCHFCIDEEVFEQLNATDFCNCCGARMDGEDHVGKD